MINHLRHSYCFFDAQVYVMILCALVVLFSYFNCLYVKCTVDASYDQMSAKKWVYYIYIYTVYVWYNNTILPCISWLQPIPQIHFFFSVMTKPDAKKSFKKRNRLNQWGCISMT